MSPMSPQTSDSSSSTSASLLRRAREHDPEAWQRLTRLYGPMVYGWSRRCGLQDHDAADAVQEVFRSVAIHLDDFRRSRPGDSFRGWLWTICRNKIRDHFRQLADSPQATGGSAQQQNLQKVPDSPPWDDSNSAETERSRLFKRVLPIIEAEFPPHQWQAFLGVIAEDKSPADVADALGISVWSVYQAKSRILRRLRQEMQDLED